MYTILNGQQAFMASFRSLYGPASHSPTFWIF